jgi:retinol dehydrogenase 12
MIKKTILITGATNGIGQAAAIQMAHLDARVIVAGRSLEKCEQTVRRIRLETGNPDVDFLLADLSEMRQVRRLADQCLERYERLDVLVNNAGAVFIDRKITSEGLERAWAVNYFQAFLLTRLLQDRLIATGREFGQARIINISSIYHKVIRLKPDSYQERGLYIGWNVYARTKLADLYFTYELARRLQSQGIHPETLSVNALHPGFVATGMGKTSGWLLRAAFRVVDLFSIPAEEGARGIVNLAISPNVTRVTGGYFEQARQTHSSKISYSLPAAKQLWEVSEEITSKY